MAMPQLTLKDIREKKGFTRAELERTTGHSHKSISKWERQESYPPIDTLGHLIAGMAGQLRLVADFGGEMFEIRWEKPDADDES